MRSLFVLIGASLLFACGDRQPESPASSPLAPAGKVTDNSSDRAALIAFYKATGGDNWKDRTGWLSDAPLNQWHGVKVDDQGRVIWLHLGGNGLTGTIPAALAQLKNLKWLHLFSNGLTGAIPKELAQLKNLKWLYLFDNGLTGAIPKELAQLKNLERLFLSRNELTGAIPAALAQLENLSSLYLFDNELTGAIPAALAQLENLKELFLSSNELTGCIPVALQAISNHDLDKLGLDACSAGTDDSVTDDSDRDTLIAFYQATGGDGWKKRRGWNSDAPLNQWHGVTTDDQGRVTGLNLIKNRLTGSIPDALGKLENLQILKLTSNQLTGKIPDALGKLEKLQTLKLRKNQLTGCIPAVLQAQAIPNHDLDKLGLAFCE